MIKMRSSRLKVFRHDVRYAYDVELDDEEGGDGAGEDGEGGNGKGGRRMVLYESVSTTVFRDDEEKKAVEVAEFSTVELVRVQGLGQEGGVDGWRARVLRTFMDASPVVQRMKQIQVGGGKEKS
jgi:hypothetical protein